MSKVHAVIGLKNATKEEISLFKVKYPKGMHLTHDSKGKKLPYNGIFKCNSFK